MIQMIIFEDYKTSQYRIIAQENCIYFFYINSTLTAIQVNNIAYTNVSFERKPNNTTSVIATNSFVITTNKRVNLCAEIVL